MSKRAINCLAGFLICAGFCPGANAEISKGYLDIRMTAVRNLSAEANDELRADAADEHQPKLVIKYLDSVPPNARDGKTRSQALIKGWKKGKYLRNMNEVTLEKLSAGEPAGKKYKIGANELQWRIRMLFDTQYTIELFHEELLELLRAAEIS